MTATTVPTVTAAAAMSSMIGAALGTAVLGIVVVVVVVVVIGASIRREEVVIGASIRREEVAQHLHHALHEATQVTPAAIGNAAATAAH
jgi:hypothetical protein